MLNNKTFLISNMKQISTKAFTIVNGLQQGTVNSPTLFNIFIHDLLNKIENIIGFADDIIIYHADDKIHKINEKLQNYFNIVEKYSSDWQMNINFGKCETILFRPPVGKCNYNIRKNWRQFCIKSGSDINIQNKETVKYLGIYLDKFLYFHNHINNQIEKARKAFFMYKTFFFLNMSIQKLKLFYIRL